MIGMPRQRHMQVFLPCILFIGKGAVPGKRPRCGKSDQADDTDKKLW